MNPLVYRFSATFITSLEVIFKREVASFNNTEVVNGSFFNFFEIFWIYVNHLIQNRP
jgi:hypothetical protein